MTPSKNRDLLAELGHTLRMIDEQILEIRRMVSDETTWAPDTKIYQIRDANGAYVVSPLLVARAQVLHAIVEVKTGM